MFPPLIISEPFIRKWYLTLHQWKTKMMLYILYWLPPSRTILTSCPCIVLKLMDRTRTLSFFIVITCWFNPRPLRMKQKVYLGYHITNWVICKTEHIHWSGETARIVIPGSSNYGLDSIGRNWPAESPRISCYTTKMGSSVSSRFGSPSEPSKISSPKFPHCLVALVTRLHRTCAFQLQERQPMTTRLLGRGSTLS